MISVLDSLILAAQQALYERAVQPALLALGELRLAEIAYDATEWPVIGLVELAVMVPLMIALERAFPVEAVQDRRAVFTDIVYALLHRLGVFPLLAFFLLTPAFDA
ncbi:MAG: fatty acid hydroxylase, partial [Betaproteobacteria bacterium]|nr:fatty acid hydroxylase [Betaproteobacteria bacterium]